MTTVQSLPHDLEAERALLSGLLVDRSKVLDASEIVTPGDFHSPAHGHIYQAILTLDETAQPIDPIFVADQLERDQNLEAVGGRDRVLSLLGEMGHTGRAVHYAQIIRRHSRRRKLIRVAGEIRQEAEAGADDPDTIIETAQNRIFELTASTDGLVTPIADAAADWLVHLQDVVDNGAHFTGVRTGLQDLDEKLWGLRPGQLITIAGRPGSGKSMLGAQISMEAAFAGVPVLVVTIEMSSDEITGRLVANLSRVPADRLRSGQLLDTDWPKINDAVTRLNAAPIDYLDQGTTTVGHIRAHARRMAARGNLGLIVVDYLQLLTPASRRENRQVEVAEMSGALKRIAREMNVPVIALAQLNRGLEMRADKHPTLADLRESGAIENDSDVVIGIYRDEMYNENSQHKGAADLCVLKQRSGSTGIVTVGFFDWIGRFENIARFDR